MSENISYQGRFLGHIRVNDNDTDKFVFVADKLETLAALFKINPDEEIETEGRGKIRYQEFQQDYLSRITAYYPTEEQWLLKNRRERTLDEVPDVERN